MPLAVPDEEIGPFTANASVTIEPDRYRLDGDGHTPVDDSDRFFDDDALSRFLDPRRDRDALITPVSEGGDERWAWAFPPGRGTAPASGRRRAAVRRPGAVCSPDSRSRSGSQS